MSQLTDLLYVGTLEQTFDDAIMNSISGILNVASELDFSERINKEYIKIAINDDDSNDDITKIIVPCIEWMNKFIKNNKKVIVHCLEGKSRSVCICIVYLVLEYAYTFNEAVDLVKARSMYYDPFPKYMDQIKKYIDS